MSFNGMVVTERVITPSNKEEFYKSIKNLIHIEMVYIR